MRGADRTEAESREDGGALPSRCLGETLRESSLRPVWLWPGILCAACSLLGVSCEKDPSPGGSGVSAAPAPRHPAMLEPAGTKAVPAEGLEEPVIENEGLPEGHPPVKSMPPEGSGQAGAGKTSAGSAPHASGSRLESALSGFGLSASVPAGWVEAASASSFRLATLRLPKVEGDLEDGEMSVANAMGGEEQNLKRWREQFNPDDPEPVSSKKEVSGIQVTLTEMEGTFKGASGPMAGGSGAPKPGTKLLGAIIRPPKGDQLLFFKAWGPKKTMEKWKPSFEEFVSSLKSR